MFTVNVLHRAEPRVERGEMLLAASVCEGAHTLPDRLVFLVSYLATARRAWLKLAS